MWKFYGHLSSPFCTKRTLRRLLSLYNGFLEAKSKTVCHIWKGNSALIQHIMYMLRNRYTILCHKGLFSKIKSLLVKYLKRRSLSDLWKKGFWTTLKKNTQPGAEEINAFKVTETFLTSRKISHILQRSFKWRGKDYAFMECFQKILNTYDKEWCRQRIINLVSAA